MNPSELRRDEEQTQRTTCSTRQGVRCALAWGVQGEKIGHRDSSQGNPGINKLDVCALHTSSHAPACWLGMFMTVSTAYMYPHVSGGAMTQERAGWLLDFRVSGQELTGG